jgi:zinc transport system substrate-binding protein
MRTIWVILACAFAATCSICSADVAQSEAQFVAYTSVKPVAFVMERIGAGHWTVRSLVEEGKNPHTFALTPRAAEELSASRVYLAVGIEMDAAVKSRAQASMKYVEAHVDADDPHLWLDPDGLVLIARTARDAFFEADPEHRSDYAVACSQFESEVSDAVGAARTLLEPFKGCRFYVQHDAFTRYAAAFGLVQVSVEENEKEPTAARLVEVTRMMQADGTKIVYAQPGHNPRPLQVLAESVSARIDVLDPMLSDPVDGLVARAQILADGFNSKAGPAR